MFKKTAEAVVLRDAVSRRVELCTRVLCDANHGGSQAPKLIFVLFAGAVSLVFALVTYRFVERPMTQTLHRWVSKRRPARRIPAAASLASSS